MRTLGIITARGGSKGLPRKNVLDCAGKPLIAWTIEAAKNSKLLSDFIVSTDCKEIAEVSKKYGAKVPFLRPSELATDSATIADVIKHSIEMLKENGESYDAIVLLQATSPCRTFRNIDESITLFKNLDNSLNSTLVSVYKAPKKTAWVLENKGGKLNFALGERVQQRQSLSSLYFPNGAIYISSFDGFNGEFYGENTYKYEMLEEESVDVDYLEDLKRAEYILNQR